MEVMEPTSKTQSLRYAVSGLLAALTGMAVGHLVAALVNPAASPVLAVGSTVIDATPTPVKEWAIQHFGTNDKPILLGSVGLVTALVAMGIGLVARRRPSLAGVLLGCSPAWPGSRRCCARRPDRSTSCRPSRPPSLVSASSSGSSRLLDGRAGEPGVGGVESGPLDHTAQAPGDTHGDGPTQLPHRCRRRNGRSRRRRKHGQKLAAPPTLPSSVTLPAPQSTEAALPAGLETTIKGISPFRTPPNDFYRVDTAW